jgi:3-hydroxyacyl-[acyl-carrier-protein] dehydratase
MRYLLLDRITSLSPPELATAVKCVSLSDDVFVDHFPGYPVLPGALILEALAQLGGVLIEATLRERGEPDLAAVLTFVERAKFRHAVRPGDRLTLSVHGITASTEGGQVRGVALVEEKRVAEAELGFALTKLTNPELLARRRERLEIWRAGTLEDR